MDYATRHSTADSKEFANLRNSLAGREAICRGRPGGRRKISDRRIFKFSVLLTRLPEAKTFAADLKREAEKIS